MKIPSWVIRLIGKRVVDGQIEKVGLSKAKLTAVIYVIILAVQTLAPVWGYAVTIPQEIFRVLEALGLWSVRDAIKDNPGIRG